MPATKTQVKKAKPKTVVTAVGNPQFVTPREFAELFKLGRSTVQDMMKSDVIDTVQIATAPGAKKKTRRIPWSEVERVKSGKPKPEKKPEEAAASTSNS